MEIEEVAPQSQPDPSAVVPKWSQTLSRLTAVFKSIKVPQHEPLPLTSYPKQKAAKLTVTSIRSSHVSSSNQLFIHGHQALELAGQCYALPTMSVSQEHRHVWESQIRDRLQDELAQCMRAERCHLEFHMVCDKGGKMGPCILLTCWDEITCHSEPGRERTRRKIQTKVRKLQSMQNCQFPCKVVVDSIDLLARHFMSGIGPDIRIKGGLRDTTTTLVSLLLKNDRDNASECTLGGLIRVGPQIYGLTVAHAFFGPLGNAPIEDVTLPDPSYSEDADSDGLEDSLFNGFESHQISMLAVQPERDSSSLDRRTTQHTETVVTVHDTTNLDRRPQLFEVESLLDIGHICATSSHNGGSDDEDHCDLDWALVELDGFTPPLRNSYHSPESANSTLLEAVWVENIAPNMRVVVLGGRTGPRDGVIGQANIRLNIQGRQLVVTQVILREILGEAYPIYESIICTNVRTEPGDSGSWVVKGETVVGCIVAGRRFLPMAYMIPIVDIFEDIARAFSETDVAVADASFMESFEAHSVRSPEAQTGHVISLEGPPTTSRAAKALQAKQHQCRMDSEGSFPIESSDIADDALHVGDGPDSQITIQPAPAKRSISENFDKEDHDHKSDGKKSIAFDMDVEAQNETLLPAPTPAPILSASGTPAPKTHVDPHIVDYDGPTDPLNPKNWKSSGRWANIAIISSMTLVSSVASSMVVPALDQIRREFHGTSPVEQQLIFSIFALAHAVGPLILAPLSELYGRVPLLLLSNALFFIFSLVCGFAPSKQSILAFRFVSGLGASAPLAIGGAVIGDMFRPEERGSPMKYYAMGPLWGPAIGPLLGAWVVQKSKWPWIFWGTSIANAVTLLAALWTLRESYSPYILHRKAENLRRRTGNVLLRSKGEDLVNQSVITKISRSVSFSLKMLCTEPIVQTMAVYMSISYGVLYLILGTISTSFQVAYHESIGVSGLNYISLGLGFFIGAGICGKSIDKHYQKQKNRHPQKRGMPEYRMPLALLFWFSAPLGLLTYGWSVQKHVSWPVPNIGLFLLGVGTVTAFQCVTTYIVDTYTRYAGSAMAGLTLIRALAGCGFPLFGPPMFRTINYGWGNTALAVSALVIVGPIPIIFWLFGEKLRKRSGLATRKKPLSSSGVTAMPTQPGGPSDGVMSTSAGKKPAGSGTPGGTLSGQGKPLSEVPDEPLAEGGVPDAYQDEPPSYYALFGSAFS